MIGCIERCDVLTMNIPEESFGEIVKRLLPPGVSLARMARDADADYSYLNGVVNGKKPVSVDMVEKVVTSIRRLGGEVNSADEAAMLNDAAQLPNGYRVVPDVDDEPPENWEDWPQELKDAMHYTATLTPEVQRYIYKLWKEQARAHAQIEVLRREAEGKLKGGAGRAKIEETDN